MNVSCGCCVLSGRGFYVGLITRLVDSCRERKRETEIEKERESDCVCVCVIECDQVQQ